MSITILEGSKSNEKLKINSINIDKIVFLICIIDILFFPYIRVVSASLSMIILPVWFLFNLKKIEVNKEFKLFLVALCLVILSFSLSLIYLPGWTVFSNFSKAVILTYGFLFYFFFKYYLEKNGNYVQKILITYVFFSLTLSTIYMFNPSFYFYIRSFWTMSGNEIIVQNSLLIYRFTSTFSDPNNAAIAIISVTTFLLFSKKITLLIKALILIATTIIVFSTMSTTGIILLISLLILIIANGILSLSSFNWKIKKSTFLSLLVLVCLIPLFLYLASYLMNTEVVKLSLERYEMNSAESRVEIWKTLISEEPIYKYFLYGMGGTIFLNGVSYSPHNGHLHLIYNYGFFVYLIFIYIFFRVRTNINIKHYLFLIPIIIGFTMNVGIYEPRFINLLAILVALYASNNELSVKNKKLVKIKDS